MPNPREREWQDLIAELSGEAPSESAVEARLRDELGLDEAAPAPDSMMGGLAPAAPPAPDSGIDTLDPYAEFASLQESSPELADPYESVRAKGYGPESAGQMASPEAPIFTPKGPPALAEGMDTYSDESRHLFGVDPRMRKTEDAIARLGEMRGGMPEYQAPTGPGANERTLRGGNDDQARQAFVLNWIAGGPEQAMAFQRAYDQKRQQHRRDLMGARVADTQLAELSAPISDAQAQTLVRTYNITPEAAARMTLREYKQLEPVLKSTPYAANQQDARRMQFSESEMKMILGANRNQNDNATQFGTAQLRGENALRAVRESKKKGGAPGNTGARDILPVLIAGEDIADPAQAAEALRKVEAGEEPSSQLEAQYMNTARLLTQMSGKEFMDARKSVMKSGVVGRANRSYATEEATRSKQADPVKRTQLRTGWNTEWANYQRAARGFRTLSQSGKIQALVKTPYGDWTRWINTSLTPGEQEAARAISAFINPEMRKQTGAALSDFEKSMSYQQFGITDVVNPAASPAALGGWLKGAGRDLGQVRQIINQEYGFDPLSGQSNEAM